MARFRYSIPVRAVEPAVIAQLSGVLHDVAEELTSRADGKLAAEDQRVVQEVRLLDGEHLRPGARYEFEAEDDDDPAGQNILTLVSWDRRHQTAATVRNDLGHGEARLTSDSAGPRRLTAAMQVAAPAGRFRRLAQGSGSADIDLDVWFQASGERAVYGNLDHPLLRVRFVAAPLLVKSGDWQVTLTCVIRGRGLVRPLLAVPLLVTRPLVRKWLAKGVEATATQWGEETVPWLKLPAAEQRRQVLEELCSPPAP